MKVFNYKRHDMGKRGMEYVHTRVAARAGGHAETNVRMVRAFMIEELIDREGQEYGEALMDSMGL